MTSAAPDQPGSLPTHACHGCGALIQLEWKHCGTCGTRTATDDAPEREHLVTVVVSDLQGSTALAETLDPESLRLVLDRYFDELGAVLESHGGRIEKRIGDAMVTVFGLPAARPDDAVRALRGAAESQQTLAVLNTLLEAGWGVRLTNRTGVSTGRVVYASAGGAHRVLAGAALDVASALEPLAPPLEVLVSAATAALVDGAAQLGPAQQLTSRAGDVISAHQLLTVDAGEPDRTTTFDAHECGSCGTPIEVDLAWCTGCGAPVSRLRSSRHTRRTVTIVFVDLALQHQGGAVDASAERAAMLAAFSVARAALAGHGGTIENFIGDAVMAVYGLDRRHEDDALRAVRAALDVHEQLSAASGDLLARFGVDVVARIGVNTGPVIAGDPAAGERFVTGDAVNVAARLEQTARPGDVIIGDLTRRLAGPSVTLDVLAPLVLKGKAEPVPAFRVIDVRNEAVAARRFELPLVGRDAQLAVLRAAWTHAMAGPSWRRVRIVGDAGIGKSRVVYHLLDDLHGTASVLRGTCPPYGEGITFWPVADIVRSAAGITIGTDVETARAAVAATSPDPEVTVRLLALLGLDDRMVPVPELFWAVRRLLEHLASERPLVVVIDGMQWAEPTLVELLDDLLQHGDAGQLLLLTMERGVGDDAATDEQAETTAQLLQLDPLDEPTCDELIRQALGPTAMPDALRRTIVRAAAGVPLFIEQLLTMLIDDGRLVDDGSGWRITVAIEDLTVPPTIEALLAARVDALPDDEIAVIEPASVIGREFPLAAVEQLGGTAISDATIGSLDRRQLVAAFGSADSIDDHRFRNLLIRDVVYDGLLKRTRAALHEQFADWLLEGPALGRVTEFEEIVGLHLERAYLLGGEVAAIDAAGIELGRRASTHLEGAGDRAFGRGDMPAAANLLQRAARTLHDRGTRAARLLVQAGDAKMETGAFAAAIAHYDEAAQMARDVHDEVTAAAARLARTTLGYLTGDGVDDAAALATAAELLPVFEHADDHSGAARCWRLRTYVEMFHCRWGAAEHAATETIDHAHRAADTVLEHRVLPALAGFALYGPTTVTRALGLCDQLLDVAGADRRSHSLILQFQSHLLALGGEFDRARELCASARTSLLELGWNFDAALVSIHLGPIEMMAGRPDVAERELRRDYDTLTAMGERNYLSTTTSLLAEAVRRQGRLDEAMQLADESASLAADDDVFTQIGWRSVKLRVCTERGELDQAAETLREVVELVMGTDGPYAQGEAMLDRAVLLARTGDHTGAAEAVAEATARFASKESLVALQRASDLAAQLH
ncbi:MAG: adenylate/guanylate cyclase domain-containing protein [Actinomycetota bacterium]|nr:adenylate/guanylate cyclase domain-containing protein [Actinomycetota bacterium]